MAKVIVLVGVPASGKSTYAEKILAAQNPVGRHADFRVRIRGLHTVCISYDKIFDELSANNGNSKPDASKVLNAYYYRMRIALEEGKKVVMDGPNLKRKHRRRIFENIPDGTLVEAHVVWAPLVLTLTRDSHRPDSVGNEAIIKAVKKFEPPWYDEGFVAIKLYCAQFARDQYINATLFGMEIPHHNSHHRLSVRAHCSECYKIAVQREMPEEVLTAALLHDVGKPLTKKMKPGQTEAHYYDHDNAGAWISYGFMEDPNMAIRVAWLVGNHMQPYFDSEYYRSLNAHDKQLLDMLHECDEAAH